MSLIYYGLLIFNSMNVKYTFNSAVLSKPIQIHVYHLHILYTGMTATWAHCQHNLTIGRIWVYLLVYIWVVKLKDLQMQKQLGLSDGFRILSVLSGCMILFSKINDYTKSNITKISSLCLSVDLQKGLYEVGYSLAIYALLVYYFEVSLA